MRRPVPLLLLLAATLACNTLLPRPAATATATRRPPKTPTEVVVVDATATPRSVTREPIASRTPNAARTPDAETTSGARVCAYVPGQSVAAVMPPEVGEPATPPPPLPDFVPNNTQVDAEVTAAQLNLYHQFTDDVDREYVYPDFNGVNWDGLKIRYESLIAGGLTDEDFYSVLNQMLYNLRDDHSSFESPEEAERADQDFAGNIDYVGIGILPQPVPEAQRAVIIYTFPGGPAAEAGLRAHDSILAVDGQPLLDEFGAIRDLIRGEVDTEVTLTIAHPGGEPEELTLVRRRITGATPVDFCLMPEAHIGYIFLPHLDDETIPNQVGAALDALTADGPLAGLIIDNRQNHGGANTLLRELLSLFTSGLQGYFVSREESRPFEIEPQDRDGSQSVPLVVLVGPDTASYGEVMSGVLQATGRATIIGQTSLGNVETMWGFSYAGGARAWIAHETFQYPGQEPGLWEDTGIIPDIPAPTRWDLFTEADDPALAAAMSVFGVGQ